MRARFQRWVLCGLVCSGACAQSPAGSLDRSEDHAGAELDADVPAVTERLDASKSSRDADVTATRDAHTSDARGSGEFPGEEDAGEDQDEQDAGAPDAEVDTGEVDGGAVDAALADTGVEDASEADSGVVDAGARDAGAQDDAGADAGSMTTPPAGCTSKSFEGRAYLFCSQPRDWIDSRNLCIRAMQDIVVVNSAAEGDFVAGNGDSWIGATDIDGEGHWVMPVPGDHDDYSGSDVTYTDWALGQPDNTRYCSGIVTGLPCIGPASDEDCAMVRADGSWNDADCGRTMNFVCEQP